MLNQNFVLDVLGFKMGKQKPNKKPSPPKPVTSVCTDAHIYLVILIVSLIVYLDWFYRRFRSPLPILPLPHGICGGTDYISFG